MLKFLQGILGGGKSGGDENGSDDPSSLALPFEIQLVPGKNALRAREELLPRKEITPVIMGAVEDARNMAELLHESSDSVEDILAKARDFDVNAWMTSRMAEDPEYYRIDPAKWPEGSASSSELSVHLDVLTRRPKKAVILGLVPASQSWQVPAHLRYGDWNDCPSPAVHVALHKRWHEKFGSNIACMSSDVIECTVDRPPVARGEAIELAREQFTYCPDIVHQGVESVEALAAMLIGNRTWYFWWD